MKDKHLSVFKLCAQNHAAMATLFICLCILMMVSIKRLLFPYFNNEVITSAYESIKNVEPRIITEILANRFGEASEIIETEILRGGEAIRSLNLYNIQNYDVYGLSHTCPSKIANYGWGSACVDGQNYSIEVPIKSADNTLAHVTVHFRKTINSWLPYKISQYCLWVIISATTALTFLLMKRVRRRIILPIRKAILNIERASSAQDCDLILSQIPLKELYCVTSRLFQKQQALIKLQIENIDLQTKTKMAAIATTVAHDIRSPLSSLKAAAEMLRGHVAGNEGASDAVNLLQLSSQRLEGIANGLLAKHKGIDAGPQVFSIHEVLDELVGEFQASPLGSGTEFKKQYHTDALYISGDRIGINRAIGNIIKNALEAMGQNGANKPRQLIVSTALGLPPHPSPLPEGEGVEIRITDTGPGISADKIPLILQGGHTDGKEGGNGIGTKVVKDVVEKHKGQITIDSQMGVGTTFIITLPLTIPIEGAETGMTVTIPYSGVGPIYIIDDEPSMREQWRLTLKALGIAAEVYTSWEDYVARHPEHSANTTFIIDYHFDNSEVDGVEIIRRLKARGFCNIVLATAEYWKPAIKAAAKDFGITLCPKPLPKVVVQASSPPQSAAIVSEGPAVTLTTGSPLTLNPIAGMTNLEVTKEVGPSILLIDDDSSIHFSWKMMRKSLGVGNLTMHSNLEEMIAAATNPAQFDLCVIDKNIEGSQFDGARTLEYLRQNGARTIVLASGETGDDIHKDPRFSSADGVLKSKVPMTPEELDPFLN